MNRADYSAFDARLHGLIAEGKSTLAKLTLDKELHAMATPFCCAKPGHYQTPEWRIIDRRLQALRKAGKIKYSSAAGWRIVD